MCVRICACMCECANLFAGVLSPKEIELREAMEKEVRKPETQTQRTAKLSKEVQSKRLLESPQSDEHKGDGTKKLKGEKDKEKGKTPANGDGTKKVKTEKDKEKSNTPAESDGTKKLKAEKDNEKGTAEKKTPETKATASKAKATKPAAESELPGVVNATLNRSSTSDLVAKTKAVPKAAPKTAAEPKGSDNESESSGGESDSDDDDVEKKKTEMILKKKAAHARFMRFSRSLKSILA